MLGRGRIATAVLAAIALSLALAPTARAVAVGPATVKIDALGTSLSGDDVLRINMYLFCPGSDNAFEDPGPVSPLSVAIRGGGAARKTTWLTPCDYYGDSFWRPDPGRTRRWGFSTEQLIPEFSTDVVASRISIMRRHRPKKATVTKMRFAVRQEGQVLATGRFRFETYYSRGFRVWEGSDAFINFCINRGQTIYSENGRLYCDVPTRAGTFISGLRVSR